eukprot:5901825-Pleurochrysis_carterae.AAC.1
MALVLPRGAQPAPSLRSALSPAPSAACGALPPAAPHPRRPSAWRRGGPPSTASGCAPRAAGDPPSPRRAA